MDNGVTNVESSGRYIQSYRSKLWQLVAPLSLTIVIGTTLFFQFWFLFIVMAGALGYGK